MADNIYKNNPITGASFTIPSYKNAMEQEEERKKKQQEINKQRAELEKQKQALAAQKAKLEEDQQKKKVVDQKAEEQKKQIAAQQSEIAKKVDNLYTPAFTQQKKPDLIRGFKLKEDTSETELQKRKRLQQNYRQDLKDSGQSQLQFTISQSAKKSPMQVYNELSQKWKQEDQEDKFISGIQDLVEFAYFNNTALKQKQNNLTNDFNAFDKKQFEVLVNKIKDSALKHYMELNPDYDKEELQQDFNKKPGLALDLYIDSLRNYLTDEQKEYFDKVTEEAKTPQEKLGALFGFTRTLPRYKSFTQREEDRQNERLNGDILEKEIAKAEGKGGRYDKAVEWQDEWYDKNVRSSFNASDEYFKNGNYLAGATAFLNGFIGDKIAAPMLGISASIADWGSEKYNWLADKARRKNLNNLQDVEDTSLTNYHEEFDKIVTERRNTFENRYKQKIKEYLDQHPSEAQQMEKDMMKISEEISPEYAKEKGTYMTELTKEQKRDMLTTFLARQELYGMNGAVQELGADWKNHIGETMSTWDKTKRTAKNFCVTATADIASLIVSSVALPGLGDEAYMNNLVNGDGWESKLLRWAVDLQNTGCFTEEQQQLYKEKGWNDVQIYKTEEDENAWFTMNDIFEGIGQYGFTAATTIFSLGGSALLKGVSKVVANVGMRVATNQLSKQTGKQIIKNVFSKEFRKNLAKGQFGAEGRALLEGGLKLKQSSLYYGNLTVSAWAGQGEGLLEAQSTYDTWQEDHKEQLEALEQKKVNAMNNADVLVSDDQARKYLAEKGIAKFDYKTIQEAKKEIAVKNIQEDIDAINDGGVKAAQLNYMSNSLINGTLNVFGKELLMSRDARIAARRLGGQKNKFWDNINVVKKGKEWKAIVATPNGWEAKAAAFLNKSKEIAKNTFSEGMEEYTQNISDNMSRYVVNAQVQNYLNCSYNPDTRAAFALNFANMISDGMSIFGSQLTDKDNIKAFILGASSTLIGGLSPAGLYNNARQVIHNFKTGEYKGSFGRAAFDIVSMPFEGTLLNGIRENRGQDKANQQVLDQINAFIGSAKTQAMFDGLSGMQQSKNEIEEALQNGDLVGAEDGQTKFVLSNIIMMDQLKDTEFGKSWFTLKDQLGTLKNILDDSQNTPEDTSNPSVTNKNFDANGKYIGGEQWILDQITAQKNQDGESSRTENLSDKQRLQAIADRVSLYDKIYDQYQQAKDKAADIFGTTDIDPLIMQSFAYLQINNSVAEEHLEKLKERYGEDEAAISLNKALPSEFYTTDEHDKFLSNHGNLDNAQSKLQAIKEQIATIQAKVDNGKKQYSKEQLKKMKEDLKDLNQQKDSLEDDIQEETNFQEDTSSIEIKSVLTVTDINASSLQDTAKIVLNRKQYSKEQQKYIDDYLNDTVTRLNKEEQQKQKEDPSYRAKIITVENVLQDLASIPEYSFRQKVYAQYLNNAIKDQGFVDRYAMDLRNANRKAALKYKFRGDLELKESEDSAGNIVRENFADYIGRVSKLKEEVGNTDKQDAQLLDQLIREQPIVAEVLKAQAKIDKATINYSIRHSVSSLSAEAETAMYKKLSAVKILLKAIVESRATTNYANKDDLLKQAYNELKQGNVSELSHVVQDLNIHILAEGGQIETVNAVKHWNEQLAEDRQTEWFNESEDVNESTVEQVMQDTKEVLFDYFKSQDPNFRDQESKTEDSDNDTEEQNLNGGQTITIGGTTEDKEQKEREEEEYKRKAEQPDPKVDTNNVQEKPYIEVSTEITEQILDTIFSSNFLEAQSKEELRTRLREELKKSVNISTATVSQINSRLAIVTQSGHIIGFITDQSTFKNLNLIKNTSVELKILSVSSDKNHTDAVQAKPLHEIFESDQEQKEWVDSFTNREYEDKFEYDNNNKKVGPKDANGFAVKLVQDNSGNPIQISYIRVKDAKGNTDYLENAIHKPYSSDYFTHTKWLQVISKIWSIENKWKYVNKYIQKENANPNTLFNMLFGDCIYLGSFYKKQNAQNGQAYIDYNVNQQEFVQNELTQLEIDDNNFKKLISDGFIKVLKIGVNGGQEVPVFIPVSDKNSRDTIQKCIFYSLSQIDSINSEFKYYIPQVVTPKVQVNNQAIQERAREIQKDVLNALIDNEILEGFKKDSVNRRIRLENPNYKPSSKTSQVEQKQGDNDPDANRKATGKNGKQYDTATGLAEDGSGPKTGEDLRNEAESELNEAQKKAQKIVDNIVNRSKQVSLSDSNADFYQNKNGDSYGRVTSREKAVVGNTEEINQEEEKEKKNNYKRDIATIYGNTMDFFTRSLIRILNAKKKAGTLEEALRSQTVVKDLLNELVNDEQVKNEVGFLKNGQLRLPTFGSQINNLVNGLVETYQSLGNWNIVPLDVKAFGGIKVQQGGMDVGYLNTAGTLDLLAYDENGIFHIIDMKTIYNGASNAVKINMEKGWQAQIDTYQTLLQQEYPDMKFGANYILPFSVSYSRFNRGDNIGTYDTSSGNAPKLTSFSLIKNENSVDEGFTYLHQLKEHEDVTYDYDRLSSEDQQAVIQNNPNSSETIENNNSEEDQRQLNIDDNTQTASGKSEQDFSFNSFSKRVSKKEASLIEFTNKHFMIFRSLKVNVISKIKTATKIMFSSKQINEAFRQNLANIFFNGNTFILNYVCKNKEASPKELLKSMKQYFSFYVQKGQELKQSAIKNYRIKKSLYEFATGKISESELQETFDVNEVKPSTVPEYISYLNSSNKNQAKEVLRQQLEVSKDYSQKSFKESIDQIDKTYKDMQTKLDFLNSPQAESLIEQQRKQIAQNLKENKVEYQEDKTKAAPVKELLKTKKGKYSSIALLRSVIAKSSNPNFKNLASFLLQAVKKGEMNISIEINKHSIEIEGVSKGQTISINESSLDSYEHFERVFLHEMLHSVLNVSGFAKATIEQVRLQALQSLMESTGKTEAQIIKENYGLTNVDEFISEFLTNKLFQETLKTLQVENTNGLQAFINRVLNLFRRSPYKKAVSAINQILQEQNVAEYKEKQVKEATAYDKLSDLEKDLIGKRGISEKEFNRLPSKIQNLLKECCH